MCIWILQALALLLIFCNCKDAGWSYLGINSQLSSSLPCLLPFPPSLFCFILLVGRITDFFFFLMWKFLRHVWLFATPWTIQSMEFSRPEYWSGWPFPSPGDLPNIGLEPRSPALQANSLPTELLGKPSKKMRQLQLYVGFTMLFKEHPTRQSSRNPVTQETKNQSTHSLIRSLKIIFNWCQIWTDHKVTEASKIA